MPIRGSSNESHHTRPQVRPGGRHRPEQVVAITRCAHTLAQFGRCASFSHVMMSVKISASGNASAGQ